MALQEAPIPRMPVGAGPLRAPVPGLGRTLRRVALAHQRRRLFVRQRDRALPLLRLALVAGAAADLSFLGWDFAVAGPAGLATALPARIVIAATLLLFWAGSFPPAVARRWPALWALAPCWGNAWLAVIAAGHPDGFAISTASFLFLPAVTALIAPSFGYALIGFAAATAATLGALSFDGAPPMALTSTAWFMSAFSLFFVAVAWLQEQSRRRGFLMAGRWRRSAAAPTPCWMRCSPPASPPPGCAPATRPSRRPCPQPPWSSWTCRASPACRSRRRPRP